MTTTLTILSSMATKAILAELVDLYVKQTGGAARLESCGGVEAARRIRSGERFDIVVLASDALDALGRQGFLAADAAPVFARSRTAVAVRTGMARPAECDEASLKALIASARSIGLSTGPSGASIVRMLQGWGVYEATKSRMIVAPPGVPVGRLLAQGEVDVGFQQVSELQDCPGVEIVGALAESMAPMTLFAIAVTQQASNADGLVDFLLSNAAKDAKRRHGMEAA